MFTNRAERTVREALAQGRRGGETYKHMDTIVLPTGFLRALGWGRRERRE